MATQAKFTIKRGQAAKDVTVAAGTTISGSDAIELNVDVTAMSQVEVIELLDAMRTAIVTGNWPRT